MRSHLGYAFLLNSSCSFSADVHPSCHPALVPDAALALVLLQVQASALLPALAAVQALASASPAEQPVAASALAATTSAVPASAQAAVPPLAATAASEQVVSPV